MLWAQSVLSVVSLITASEAETLQTLQKFIFIRLFRCLTKSVSDRVRHRGERWKREGEKVEWSLSSRESWMSTHCELSENPHKFMEKKVLRDTRMQDRKRTEENRVVLLLHHSSTGLRSASTDHLHECILYNQLSIKMFIFKIYTYCNVLWAYI